MVALAPQLGRAFAVTIPSPVAKTMPRPELLSLRPPIGVRAARRQQDPKQQEQRYFPEHPSLREERSGTQGDFLRLLRCIDRAKGARRARKKGERLALAGAS